MVSTFTREPAASTRARDCATRYQTSSVDPPILGNLRPGRLVVLPSSRGSLPPSDCAADPLVGTTPYESDGVAALGGFVDYFQLIPGYTHGHLSPRRRCPRPSVHEQPA